MRERETGGLGTKGGSLPRTTIPEGDWAGSEPGRATRRKKTFLSVGFAIE